MIAIPPRSVLDTMSLVGHSDVPLPLSTRLFPRDALMAIVDRFPTAVRLVGHQLVLAPIPDAHAVLREVLQQLYETER